MIIAALVTSVQLLMNAYTYGLYQALGIFIALIVTNCVIIYGPKPMPPRTRRCWRPSTAS